MFRKGLLYVALFAWGDAFVVPGDVDYAHLWNDRHELIFDPAITHDASRFFEGSDALHDRYEESFNHLLTQKSYATLTSCNNQLTNGFATFLPLLSQALFSGGAKELDYFGVSSWMGVLMLHELVHTYQLDAKHGTSHTLQKVLGNNGMWFINPNYLLPTLLIEGNAVMNESRFGIGGRLFVGQHRALVMALAKEGKLNYTRLLNNHIDFPYGSEKYLVGGYFFAYVAQRFGVDHANAFFKHHAIHYLNPLRLNVSFFEHFGVRYDAVVEAFIIHLHEQAQEMEYQKGEAIAFGQRLGDFNHDQGRIFWMQGDETSKHTLNVYDKNGTFVQTPSSLLIDKLFEEKGTFVTASQALEDPTSIVTGLFDANVKLQAGRNFAMMDRRGGHEASLFIPHSFKEAALYKDGTPFGATHSQAILDEEGAVYFAKQSGEIRTIYKDHAPLFSFRGFSSKLLEVIEDRVYFIAPTEHGSALYVYSQGAMYRASRGENIVDARMIDADTFLAATVEGDGYHLMRAKLGCFYKQTPFWYDNGFMAQTLVPKDTPHLASRPYKPHENLHFGAVNQLGYGYGSAGTSGTLGLFFIDPMFLNALQIQGTVSPYWNRAAFSYENQKSLLSYGVSGSYQRLGDTDSGTMAVITRFPLERTARTQTSVRARAGAFSWLDEVFGYASMDWNTQYKEQYGIAMKPHRAYDATLMMTQIGARTDSLASASMTQEFGSQFYVNSGVDYRHSDIGVWLVPSYVGRVNKETYFVSTYSSLGWEKRTQDVLKAHAQLSQVVKAGLYFDVLPLSLRRFSLEAGGNYFYLFDRDFYETRVGVEMELLGAHLAPFALGIYYVYESYNRTNETTVSLGVNF